MPVTPNCVSARLHARVAEVVEAFVPQAGVGDDQRNLAVDRRRAARTRHRVRGRRIQRDNAATAATAASTVVSRITFLAFTLSPSTLLGSSWVPCLRRSQSSDHLLPARQRGLTPQPDHVVVTVGAVHRPLSDGPRPVMAPEAVGASGRASPPSNALRRRYNAPRTTESNFPHPQPPRARPPRVRRPLQDAPGGHRPLRLCGTPRCHDAEPCLQA